MAALWRWYNGIFLKALQGSKYVKFDKKGFLKEEKNKALVELEIKLLGFINLIERYNRKFTKTKQIELYLQIVQAIIYMVVHIELINDKKDDTGANSSSAQSDSLDESHIDNNSAGDEHTDDKDDEDDEDGDDN